MTTRLERACIDRHAAARGEAWRAALMEIAVSQDEEWVEFDSAELAIFKQRHTSTAIVAAAAGPEGGCAGCGG